MPRYRCGQCERSFDQFAEAGKCPHCGIRASVRCTACGFHDTADVFIAKGDRCPSCGAHVSAADSPQDDPPGCVMIPLMLPELIADAFTLGFSAAGEKIVEAMGPGGVRLMYRICRWAMLLSVVVAAASGVVFALEAFKVLQGNWESAYGLGLLGSGVLFFLVLVIFYVGPPDPG